VRDFSLVFKQLSEAFASAAADDRKQDMAKIVSSLAERVCSGCMFHNRCWKKEFFRTYQSFCNLMVETEQSRVVTADMLPAPITRYCPRTRELAAALNSYQEICRMELECKKRVVENQGLVSQQLTGIAQVLNELAQEINLDRVEEEGGNYHQECFKVGIAQDNAKPGEFCGDAYSLFSYGGEDFFVISDGMGSGSSARDESEAAVQLLQRLIATGFKRELSLRTLNTLLRLRDRERFATIDMAVFNVKEPLVEIIKIGAPPSYLVREGEVFLLKGAAPPIGILDQVEPNLVRQRIQEQDLIVMVSDGVVEPLDQDRWLQEFLQQAVRIDPQKLAEEILSELKARVGLEDDRTVIAIYICKLLN